MGSLNALAFSEQVEDGNISLTTALSWHLGSNHYPPVPQAFVATCREAIFAGREEDWDAEIALPQGCNDCHVLLGLDADLSAHEGHDVLQAVEWKDGQSVASAGALIESFHLDSFL